MIQTFGAKKWLSTLKERWNLNFTELRENEDRIIILHTKSLYNKPSGILLVGEYNKITKVGYVLDRRVKEVNTICERRNIPLVVSVQQDYTEF